MTKREMILARVKANQPALRKEGLVNIDSTKTFDAFTRFRETLVSIGGSLIEVPDESTGIEKLKSLLPPFRADHVIIAAQGIAEKDQPHALENTDVAIIRGEFAVAENGAIWVTEQAMIDRALPFICLHLVLVIRRSQIVPTMHEAYEKIGNAKYNFGTFIAGPSKTADIEQSLVLGAHGAKTMTCFVLAD